MLTHCMLTIRSRHSLLRRLVGLAMLASAGIAAAPCQSNARIAPAQTAPSGFEVASVKPAPPNDDFMSFTTVYPANRFTAKNINLGILISIAYGVDSNKILGGPDWLDSGRYDIAAKVEGDAGLTREQMQPLLQHLVEQRFHLTAHRDTKELDGYALVVARGAPRLKASKGAPASAYRYENNMVVQNASLQTFAGMLELPAGRPVIDKTGIEGAYDFNLKYSTAANPDPDLPDLFTSLQQQLGLKLEPQKVPVAILVIDHVDRTPTAN
jgi:uncharacterized protein (TIGR03435 family)